MDLITLQYMNSRMMKNYLIIKFAGGLKAEVASNSLKLVRFNNPEFVSYEVNQMKLMIMNYKILILYMHSKKKSDSKSIRLCKISW